jgi:predicted ATPase
VGVLETALVVGSLFSSVNSAYQQDKAARQAKAEANRQAQAAEKARLQQEQDFNRKNQNTADISSLLQGNTPSGATGLTGGTYLPGQLGSGGMLGR